MLTHLWQVIQLLYLKLEKIKLLHLSVYTTTILLYFGIVLIFQHETLKILRISVIATAIEHGCCLMGEAYLFKLT